MSNSEENPTRGEGWYALRDFVLTAAHGQKLDLELLAGQDQPELVELVQRYLESGKSELIDKAAQLVASSAPGMSKGSAASQPWLVLEKA